MITIFKSYIWVPYCKASVALEKALFFLVETSTRQYLLLHVSYQSKPAYGSKTT